MKRKTRKGKGVASPQVFDPEDFDVHSVENSFRSKVFPRVRKEKLADLKKDVSFFRGKENFFSAKGDSKSVLAAVVANVIVPGLGNVYVERSVFSISVLVFSLIVMLSTFSPVFPIIQLFGFAQTNALSPYSTVESVLLVPQNVLVNNQLLVGPTFSILAVPIFLSWFHLLYLFVSKNRSVKWMV